jgi:hypothetical protein
LSAGLGVRRSRKSELLPPVELTSRLLLPWWLGPLPVVVVVVVVVVVAVVVVHRDAREEAEAELLLVLLGLLSGVKPGCW